MVLLSGSSERLSVPEVPRAKVLGIGAAALGATYIRKKQREALRRHKENANIHVEVAKHDSDQGEAAFIFDTGLFMDPIRLRNALGERMEHLGPSYFMRHAPNVEENRAKELEILEKEKGRKIVTVSTSKGGLDRVRMMADADFMREHDFITLANFDSATFKVDHLTEKGRNMARAGLWLEDSYIAAVLFDWRNGQLEKKNDKYAVRKRGPESFQIAQADAAVLMAETPHFTDEAVRNAFGEENIGSIVAIAAASDAMVNTQVAADWLAETTGRAVDYAIDDARPAGDHAGMSRTPDKQLHVIERHLGVRE
jgi:hypothetical protein